MIHVAGLEAIGAFLGPDKEVVLTPCPIEESPLPEEQSEVRPVDLVSTGEIVRAFTMCQSEA